MTTIAPGYEALPIYRVASGLVISIERIVREFSRYHKYQFGARLRQTALEVLLLVGRAYRRGADRGPVLVELCEHVEELKLLVNVGKEVEAFASFKQYAQVMEQVVSLARQAEGWRKATQRLRPTLPSGGREPL